MAARQALAAAAILVAMATGSPSPRALTNRASAVRLAAKQSPPGLGRDAKAEILAALSDIVTKAAFVPGIDLSRWQNYLARERDEIDAADNDFAFARAVDIALRDFGISHIVLLPPREAAERRRRTAIGVGLSAVARRDGVTVTMVAPKTSAYDADIHEGDRILSIDGQAPTTERLRSPEGTDISVRIQSATGSERTVRLRSTRFAKVPSPTVDMDGDVAVLRIWGFEESYDPDRIEDLMKKAKAAKYLVLDLRSNGGGEVLNVLHLLSQLLPPRTAVGTFLGKDDVAEYLKRHPDEIRADPVKVARTGGEVIRTFGSGRPPFGGKIAVLINRGSASASEIAAEALRELAGATLVGTATAGAVLDSVWRQLPYGYEVQFPVRDYVSQGGVRLEKNPIHPDQEVAAPATKTSDPTLDAAVERLRNSG